MVFPQKLSIVTINCHLYNDDLKNLVEENGIGYVMGKDN
jgi:hypothetical protein